jgi:hypothetical protein
MTDHDLGTITLCAVRYAMGRQTYMPGLVQDYCRRNWATFDVGARACITRDVREALAEEARCPGRLGADFDVADWAQFLAFCESAP